MVGSAVKSQGIYQPKSSIFSKIKKGDTIVYYTSKDFVIVGIFQVISEIEYLPNDKFWGEKMVYEIKPIEMPIDGYYLNFKQLLKNSKVQFDFIPNKSIWGSYLQGRTCISLSIKDFAVIQEALTNQSYLCRIENFKITKSSIKTTNQ